MVPNTALLLAAALLAAPLAAAAQSPAPAPFQVELVDPLNTGRGGPVRARTLAAPAAAQVAPGDILSGDARVDHLPDGQTRILIRWTSVRPASGKGRALAPPGETTLRTGLAVVDGGTRMRVAWAQARRELDLPDGPNAAQLEILRRSREAGRLGPPGTGTVITLDMLTGAKPNPLGRPVP